MFPADVNGDWRSWLMVIVISLTGAVLSESDEPVKLVPYNPELVKQVGETHIVTCMSPGGLNTMWLGPNGKQITDNTGSLHVESARNNIGQSLMFNDIQSKHNGTYTCASTIDNKEKKKSFRLIVIVPIKFMDTAEVQISKEHTNTTLLCEVTGDPQPKVSWQINGKLVEDGDKYKVIEDGLFVSNVTLEDRGEYTCRAFQMSTIISKMENKVITLNIQHKPKWEPKESTGEVYGYLAGVVNLTCKVIAEPEAEFEWLKNNKTIAENSNITIYNMQHSSTLQLVLVNSSVFGDYVCKANNSVGTMEKVLVLREGDRADTPSVSKEVEATDETLELNIEDSKDDSDKLEILGYQVQYLRRTSNQMNWDAASTVYFNKGTPYILRNLSHDTLYSVQVAARNLAGFSPYSPVANFRTEKMHADPRKENNANAAPCLWSSTYLTLVLIWGSCLL